MHKTIIHILPKDKLSMHKAFIYVLSYGQVLHAQDIHLCPVLSASSPCTRHSFMSCPNAKFSTHKTLSYVLSSVQVLHAQDTHLCSVLRTSSPCTRHSFMLRPKDKFSMHKTLIYVRLRTSSPCTILIYVLSSGQVLHAKGTHLWFLS